MKTPKRTTLKQIEISNVSNSQLFILSRGRGHRNSVKVMGEAIDRYLASPDIQAELKSYEDPAPVSQVYVVPPLNPQA